MVPVFYVQYSYNTHTIKTYNKHIILLYLYIKISKNVFQGHSGGFIKGWGLLLFSSEKWGGVFEIGVYKMLFFHVQISF